MDTETFGLVRHFALPWSVKVSTSFSFGVSNLVYIVAPESLIRVPKSIVRLQKIANTTMNR